MIYTYFKINNILNEIHIIQNNMHTKLYTYIYFKIIYSMIYIYIYFKIIRIPIDIHIATSK